MFEEAEAGAKARELGKGFPARLKSCPDASWQFDSMLIIRSQCRFVSECRRHGTFPIPLRADCQLLVQWRFTTLEMQVSLPPA